ncbi:MAG: type II toxin-antitoxin system HigB family toxin [Thermodesulfobacteriota bacterium]
MRVMSRRTLEAFWERHRDSEQPLRAWYAEAKKARWTKPVDVIRSYPNARAIGKDRLVFDIKGNAYRLVVAVRYDKGLVFVRFVGTHSEYDRIDAATV